ncbi:MAG: glycosyltransferase [Verrucomicrobia bacterium]|nr:glycosyltransferase [Verrucomicrobiota bacterium]
MKLLHVTTTTDPALGGVAEAVRQMCEALQALGHESEVATTDDTPRPGYPVPHHALGPARGSYRYTPALLPWLRAQAGRFDAVLAHGLWQHPSFAVRRAVRGRRPYFVWPHGMLDPWFKRTYPRKHLKKWLYWPWGEYPVLRDAAAVLFTCEEERRLARQSFWLYQAREAVAPLGLADPGEARAEAQRTAFFERFPDLRGRRLLLFLGRLHVKKGCDLLLEAFVAEAAAAPDAQLVMAGPDQTGWQPELAALARRLGVADRIAWTGMLTGDLKWGALRAAEAFVLPSHQENFGLAVVEALACGTPVLLSDQVNIWREATAEDAGLAAPDTAEGTRHLVRAWLADAAWSRRRSAARARFLQAFESAAAARHLSALLQSHLARA